MQHKQSKRTFSMLLALIMVLSLSTTAFAAKVGDRVTVTVLQTSDLHGMVNAFDYASNKESAFSMAHVAGVVAAERKTTPDLLLVDTGDTIQANYIQEFRTEVPHPMISAMNHMKYDAWTLGNHEFNFEFKNLENAISQFKGTILAGNIYKADGSRWQQAYKIFEIDGVKVAIFGIDAPHVPQWEKSDSSHFDKMTFTTPMEETGKILEELKGKADVIIGNIHYGLEGEYGVEGVQAIAEKYADQLDALLIGHAHATVEETIAGVPVLEPANNGKFVGKLSITLEKKNGAWDVVKDATTATLIDSSKVAPDPAFVTAMQDVHTKSLSMAAKEVGTVGKTFVDPLELLPGIPNAIIQDTALIDLINKVQMEETGADVSLAALFDASSNLTAGPFLHRDGVKIYKYDNTLFAVKVTGAQLKAIMELQAGNFFNQYKPGDVTISFDPNIRMYNYDMFAGVNYEIDISKPEGSRIVNITYKGAALKEDQQLVLALNNYRYGGLTSAGMIDDKPEAVVYEGGAIRDMIGTYVAKVGTIMPECDNNWKIVGAPLDDPQKDLIYDKVRSGEIKLPVSEDGRTPNVAALNGPALRASGAMPALAGETPTPVPTPAPVPTPSPTPAPVPTPDPAPSANTYTVKSGDCLWHIAAKNLGSGNRWTEIYEMNKRSIKSPSAIQIGQILEMPAA